MKKPIDFKFNQNKSYNYKLILTIAIWLIILSIIGYSQIKQFYKYSNLKQEFNALNIFINNQKNNKNKTLSQSKKSIEKNLNIKASKISISKILNLLSVDLEYDIKFSKIAYSQNYTIIEGFTKKLSYLTKFISYLNKIDLFEDITLENIQEKNTKQPDKELLFKVKFKILN